MLLALAVCLCAACAAPDDQTISDIQALRISTGGGLLANAPPPTVWMVTNTNDSGSGSLRALIAGARAGDTITFALTYPSSGVPSKIKLSSGPLLINKSLTISGPGSSYLAISGENVDAVFVVNGATTATISGLTIEYGNNFLGNCIYNAATLTLTDATVASCGTGVQPDGSTYYSPHGQFGGGIFNQGILDLVNTRVWNNDVGCDCARYVGVGGGIFNYFGAVTLSNSDVSYNATHGNVTGGPSEGGGGGGIFNYGGTVSITGTIISGNTSSFGGGIFNYFGATTASNSVVSGNVGWGGGGGILNFAAPNMTAVNGTVTLTNSTVSGNTTYDDDQLQFAAFPTPGIGSNSGGGGNGGGCEPPNCIPFQSQPLPFNGGGGIENFQGVITATNVTIAGNVANNTDGASQALGGGGLLNSLGNARLTNVTFWGNSAYTAGTLTGGAIENVGAGVSIKNSIVANSSGAANCGGTTAGVISGGYNLSDDASCAAILTQAGDRNSTAAGLDVGLDNNGGTAQTIALLATSPAVDAIPLADCTDFDGVEVATDERGVSRPRGAGCDSGAFEYVPKPLVQTNGLIMGLIRQ
jgi:hypothetical protein